MCESAYSIGHAGETNPAKSRIRIARSHEEADVYCIPVKCIACENPPCMVVCPANAISTHPENGSRVEDKNRCIGCNSRAFVCPFSAIVIAGSIGKAFVCDQCEGDPLYARFCPWEAIEYVACDKVCMKLKRESAHYVIDAMQSPLQH